MSHYAIAIPLRPLDCPFFELATKNVLKTCNAGAAMLFGDASLDGSATSNCSSLSGKDQIWWNQVTPLTIRRTEMSQQTNLAEQRRLKSAQTGRQKSVQKPGAKSARRKFLRFFPKGFHDQTYIDWERGYKWEAHRQWDEFLARQRFRSLLQAGDFEKIAAHAVRIESRTNLLFSFEKMALRDAVKSEAGARLFSEGLYDFLFGTASLPSRFNRWCEVVSALPRKQTRVLTWPVVTVFGFLAQPEAHIFLKPQVTKIAAQEYGFDFSYKTRPAWDTYASLLDFANLVRRDVKDLRPRDLIDIQSFIWVQGSDEYEE